MIQSSSDFDFAMRKNISVQDREFGLPGDNYHRRIARCVLVLLMMFSGVGAVAADFDRSETPYETAEWALYAVMGGASWYISQQEPRSGEPWLEGSTSASYRKESVPAWSVGVGAGGAGVLLALLPNEYGMFNYTTYCHVQGYCGAMAVTGLGTVSAKYLVARRRPSYDNYPISEKETDGRMSFFSGHSAVAFCSATYLSLYLFDHVAGDNIEELLAVSAASSVVLGLAGYTAWSRVDDNRHHPSDVLTGSMYGALSAGIMYVLHEQKAVRAPGVRLNAGFSGSDGFLSCSISF